MQKNILIVSENVNLINLLQTDSERSSFVVSCSQISLPKVKSFLLRNCCLIILNMLMTEEKGFTLLLEIRKIHDVPILIVSSNTNVIDMVCAIRMGADDYLISPFEDSEMMARVHSLIRR